MENQLKNNASYYSDLYESENKDIISFNIEEINDSLPLPTAIPNTIRKMILSRIETFTIDRKNIMITKNTTMLNNDFISHRISLIPFKTEEMKKKNIVNVKVSCFCENQPKSNEQILITDDQEKNMSTKINHSSYDEMKWITVQDFQFTNQDTKEKILTDEITFPKFLLGAIRPKQLFEFHAIVQLGFPQKKYPEGGFYGSSYDVGFVNAVYTMDEKEIEKIIQEKKLEGREKNKFLIEEAHKYYFKNKHGEPSKFTFTIESFGPYSPYTLYKQGIIELQKLIQIFQYNLQTKDENKIQILKNPKVQFESFDFILKNQTDIVPQLLYDFYIHSPDIVYIGYVDPHPLEEIIVLRISLNKKRWEYEQNVYRTFLIEKTNEILKYLEQYLKQWEIFIKNTKPSNQKPNKYSQRSFILKNNKMKEITKDEEITKREFQEKEILPKKEEEIFQKIEEKKTKINQKKLKKEIDLLENPPMVNQTIPDKITQPEKKMITVKKKK